MAEPEVPQTQAMEVPGGTPPAPPQAQPTLEQALQAIQLLARGLDGLRQDYLQTKAVLSGVVTSLNDNMTEEEQTAFLSELDALGEEYALGPEEKKLLYEDYQTLVKEAGDQAPSALEYFKTYVPQMTKGTSERMAKLDGLYQALRAKEAAESEQTKETDAETLKKQQFQTVMEAL